MLNASAHKNFQVPAKVVYAKRYLYFCFFVIHNNKTISMSAAGEQSCTWRALKRKKGSS